MVGRAMQVSVQRPAQTIFLRPVRAIAATKFLSSQEFIDDRSIGSWFGNTAFIWGQIFPLKLFVSTVVSTTGTSNTWVAFASATVLLIIVCRSKLLTPNSICGWWSIRATTQLSGVSKPFSLSFTLPLLELISTPFPNLFLSLTLIYRSLGPLMWTLTVFLIVVINALHIRHLQPSALSTICSQQLILGLGKSCEVEWRNRKWWVQIGSATGI